MTHRLGFLFGAPALPWTTDERSETAEITVHARGQVEKVYFMRWTNANREKEYRLQPFGVTLSDFREVGGCRLPLSFEARNMFGTDDVFAVLNVEVTRVRFPACA